MKKTSHSAIGGSASGGKHSTFPGRARSGYIPRFASAIALRRRRMHSAFSSGFTLVELLIVIVLMAIIIGMAAPAFVGMGRGSGMRGAVSGVRSTLSLLRQWAITHREEVIFYYFEGVAPAASYYYAVNASGTLIEKTNELPLEVMFVGDGTNRFKTDGGVQGNITQDSVVTIQDRKPSTPRPTKTISINRLTGGIRVE